MTAKIVWPVAAVLVALLVLALLALMWTGRRADELAIERQVTQVRATLAGLSRQSVGELGKVAAQQAKLAGAEEQAVSAGALALSSADTTQPAGFAVLVTADHGLITGRIGGEPAAADNFDRVLPRLKPVLVDLSDRLTQSSLRPGDTASASETRPDGVARLVAAGSELELVTAVPVPDATGSGGGFGAPLLVTARNVPLAHLAKMLQGGGFDDLRLERHANWGPASVPVLGGTGAGTARLVWTPDQPGTRLIERMAPALAIALVAVALFSGFMFAHVRRVLTDLIAREARATHRAFHDTLSGLPNRAFFIKKLETELARIGRGSAGACVLFLDLDRFKEINDTFGHAAGDELIRLVAHRLKRLLRSSDVLARFGGDEFAILQTDVRSARDGATLAARILEVLQEPMTLKGATAQIGVSIGIALAPDNAMATDRLMQLADLALYRAKNEGKNRYCFFEEGMDEALRLRQLVEDDLRGAIERNELELAYQPQFSADGQRLLGVEALVRWTHPKHGIVQPDDFIPIAEERGLIGLLGEWVLRQASRDSRRWATMTVAVNVSPIQFRQKDFVSSVVRVLNEEKADPTRIELELTEGVVVEDADTAEIAMFELRSAGLRFALDDFGTGYSSLIYLRRFAFDKIKIDRSFLESMGPTGESAILVHSIVHLGRALGLTVTAEGVETADQQRFLQAVGCHEVQGYLFCRPVPAARIDELFAMTDANGVIQRRDVA